MSENGPVIDTHVVCWGGPLAGQWFTDKDFDQRVRAAQHTGIGSAPEYVRTDRQIPHPDQHDPKVAHLTARVFVWQGIRMGPA